MPGTTIATINGGALALPDSANPSSWKPEHLALMEFAGLVSLVPDASLPKNDDGSVAKRRVYAPAGVTQAFLAAVARSGLDPFARQIYAAEIGGKWILLGAIDGFRAIAEASREYEGRTPVEYTADGITWTEVWLNKATAPAAARVGIYRKGFREAVYTTITWNEFGKTTAQWRTMPAWMMGIRVLSHAFRDSFPQQLSGIYTREDMEGDGTVEQNEADSNALLAEIEKIEDITVLRAFYKQHEADLSTKIHAAIMARAGVLGATPRTDQEETDQDEAADGVGGDLSGPASDPTPEAPEAADRHLAPPADDDAPDPDELEAYLAAKDAGK